MHHEACRDYQTMMSFCPPKGNKLPKSHITKFLLDSVIFTTYTDIAIGNARPKLIDASCRDKKNDVKKLNILFLLVQGVVIELICVM